MQLLETKVSGLTRLSGSSVRVFWIKLTSGSKMLPEARPPVALISTRLLPSKVRGSVPKGAREKSWPKKAVRLRSTLPPRPSAAKARMSLSSRATTASAVMVMSPPLSAPELTKV